MTTLEDNQKKVGNTLKARLRDEAIIAYVVTIIESFTDGARVRVHHDDSVVFLPWRNFCNEN